MSSSQAVLSSSAPDGSLISSFTDIWPEVEPIHGWLTEDQGRMLYEVAGGVAAGEAIVEIGSHHGRSTIVLALAKEPHVTLLAVDPYADRRWGGGSDALKIFQANIARVGVADQLRLARQTGSEAGSEWDGSAVGMLYLDGAHDYETVSADLAAWRAHLSPNATVLMHDAYSSLGVTRAVFAHMFASREFLYVDSSRSLVRFRRTARASPVDVARSSARMLRKLPWLARNLLIKYANRRGWDPVVRVLGRRDAACLH